MSILKNTKYAEVVMQNVSILNSESGIDQRAEAELGRAAAWHVTNCKTVNRPRLRTPAASRRTFKTFISTIQQPTATLMLLLLPFYTISFNQEIKRKGWSRHPMPNREGTNE